MLSQHAPFSPLRDGKPGTKLNNVGAVLSTNNRALCIAMSDSKIRSYDETRSDSISFPAAILTENLSTLLWTLNPDRDVRFHKNALINECIKSLRLKTDILRRFYKDIKRKHAVHAISDEDYHAAVTSRIAGDILKELTFNDQNLYQDETAIEVLRRINERERIDKEEKISVNKTQQKLLWYKSWKVARWVSLVFGLLLAGIMIWRGVATINNGSMVNWIIFAVLTIFLGGWGAWNWLKWIPSRDRMTFLIARKIYNSLSTCPIDFDNDICH